MKEMVCLMGGLAFQYLVHQIDVEKHALCELSLVGERVVYKAQNFLIKKVL